VTWFNKICKIEKLTSKYIHITVGGSNQQSKNTKHAAIKYRLNQEIKFLYKKEESATGDYTKHTTATGDRV
jgi:hypothetical protein